MIKDVVYKILILGDPTSGKTTILLRYCDNFFQEQHLATKGLDYRLKTISLKDCTTINLQIWDNAGLDRFRAITKYHYKGSHGIMLIYNVTDIKSKFEKLDSSNKRRVSIMGSNIYSWQ